MKKSLFSKLVAAFTVIISISFIITAGFLSFWFESYYFEQRKSQLISESEFISGAAVKYIYGNLSHQRIGEVIENIGGYLSTNIWLVDNYGYVYAVSNEKYKSLIGKQMLTKELEELRLGNSIEKKGAYVSSLGEYVHTFEIPIFHKGVFKGSIVMHTSMDEIKGPLKKVYDIIWLAALIAIIGSSFVIYYFSQRIIIKPLAQINHVADKISKGEVDKRVHIKSTDEIGELAKSFNSMANSLEEVDKNRRDFISNVSHEIRSPITSIKGFISGILDGIIPPEKEKYYLSIAYEETKRLTRLVNDLLDLSAIEAGQLKLTIGEIDINEIIRITVIKFETKIREKKAKLDICLKEDNLYVIGDRDRLIQVVTNLIDNAIKYVNEQGTISITTKVRGNKAYISVFNEGPCIDEDDLKNIWSRFYKADKARSSKVSTGLGLPIVRSILTQLGEDIWAENKKDEGVIFTFTLKTI